MLNCLKQNYQLCPCAIMLQKLLKSMELIWLFFAEWGLRLCSLFVNAAAALPVIIALGIIAGRRGRADFILNANTRLTYFALCISPIPPLWYFCDYLLRVAPVARPENSLFAPLFSSAGFGWLSSVMVTLCAAFCLYLALGSLRAFPVTKIVNDKYKIRDLRPQITLLLCCALLYFSAFWLINCPFGGLPPELSLGRAMAAVGKNAARHYFMSFSAAGAIGLLFSIFYPFPNLEKRRIATRWLSFWAAAGYLPYMLTSSGFALGLLAGHRPPSYDMSFHFINVGSLACAFVCWLLLLFGKKNISPWLILCGCFFLALHASAPMLSHILARLN